MAQWYYGNASYFDPCPVRHDGCDNFRDIAYGHWFTDQSCGILPQRGCDVRITIRDRCKGTQVNFPISTQCSCAYYAGCSLRTRCNGILEGYSTPILDLTSDLFLYLHGNLTDGRVRFSVYT